MCAFLTTIQAEAEVIQQLDGGEKTWETISCKKRKKKESTKLFSTFANAHYITFHYLTARKRERERERFQSKATTAVREDGEEISRRSNKDDDRRGEGRGGGDFKRFLLLLLLLLFGGVDFKQVPSSLPAPSHPPPPPLFYFLKGGNEN